MKMLGKALTLLLAVMATLAADAQQKLTWSVDFGTVFENREGDNYYSPDQTIFFTRLSPEVGLSMLDGMHNIAGGVSWIQPVGNGWRDYKLCPTLYYSYKSPTWRLAVGMLPRTMLLEEMHTVLLSDSMRYRQPNIRGVLLQYVKPKGFFELSLDWRSLQTDTQREAFNVNLNGRWNPCGALLVGGRVQLNHLAKSSSNYEDQGVNDDIKVNPYVGLICRIVRLSTASKSRRDPSSTLSATVATTMGGVCPVECWLMLWQSGAGWASRRRSMPGKTFIRSIRAMARC